MCALKEFGIFVLGNKNFKTSWLQPENKLWIWGKELTTTGLRQEQM
jgi:hypothetical protein